MKGQTMSNTQWPEDAFRPGSSGEFQATRIIPLPEQYLAADVEMMAKGGWKRTVKVSVRTFDGNQGELYQRLEELLISGLNITTFAINNHEKELETIRQEEANE